MPDRRSVFDYFTARITIQKRSLSELLGFLIRCEHLIVPSATNKQLFATKSMMTTPLTQLATQAVSLGLDQLFSLMVVPPKNTAIPEIFTFRHIPFDLMQMPSELASAAQLIPSIHDKIVVNLTPSLKATGQFSDLTGFQSTMVRDLLSRSFFTNTTTTWLTPRIALFVAKIYSMSLGGAIADWFQLDVRQRGIVSTILAFYMLQQMSTAENAETYLRANRKQLYLPEAYDLEQIFGHIQETLGVLALDTLDDAYTAINAIGISRMVLNRRVVLSKTQKWGPDLPTSSLALEYAPYFIYLLLLCVSGAKIGLSFRLQSMKMLRDCETFSDDLQQCTTFLPALV